MRALVRLLAASTGLLTCQFAFAQNPCLIVIHHAIGIAELRDAGLDRDSAIDRQFASRSTNALQNKEHERALIASVARWAYIQRDLRPENFGAFHYSACRFGVFQLNEARFVDVFPRLYERARQCQSQSSDPKEFAGCIAPAFNKEFP
jgi:hypothetical protein